MLVCGTASQAEVFYAQEEALQLAFPRAEKIERRTFVLDDAQVQQVELIAKARLDSKIVTFYQATHGPEISGYALIETHSVRTHAETVMTVLDAQGRIDKTVVLAFHEPPEYMVSERWLKQFAGQSEPQSLVPGGQIAGIVGSTLTSQAIASSVRRVLALYKVLIEKGN